MPPSLLSSVSSSWKWVAGQHGSIWLDHSWQSLESKASCTSLKKKRYRYIRYASKKTLHTVVFSRREKNSGLTVLLPSFDHPLTSLLPVHKTLAKIKLVFLQLTQAWKAQLAPVYMGHMYRVSSVLSRVDCFERCLSEVWANTPWKPTVCKVWHVPYVHWMCLLCEYMTCNYNYNMLTLMKV